MWQQHGWRHFSIWNRGTAPLLPPSWHLETGHLSVSLSRPWGPACAQRLSRLTPQHLGPRMSLTVSAVS